MSNNLPRTIRLAVPLTLACVMLALSACATNRDVTDSAPEADTISPVTEIPAADTAATTDAASPEGANGTIGEQLGRLDAMMQTAPADSLPILQAEYERLLALATRGTANVQTGAGDRPPVDAQVEVDSVMIGADTLVAGPDGLVGFRRSELGAPEERARTSRAAARTHTVSVPVTAEPRTDPQVAERGRQRSYVDGLASMQSGNYEQAARELPAVVAAPPAGKRTTAQYSYGKALEKTGNTSRAAEQYRTAATGNDAMAHKSYLSYCRLLAQSGQRDKARKLLVEFIGKNPKSTQTVNARQLLQTL